MTELHYCGTSQRMYELHDALPWAASQRNWLCTWDMASQQRLSLNSEFMENYELCCGPQLMDNAGNELVCGATHRGRVWGLVSRRLLPSCCASG